MTVSQRKFAELAAPIFGTSVGVARRKLQAWDKLGILSPIEKQGERKASRYSSEQLEDVKRILQEQAQAKYEGAISLFNTHDITPATNAETIEDSEENFKAIIPADNNDAPDNELQDPPDDTAANEVQSVEELPLEKKNDSEATPPMCNVPAVQSPPFIEDMAGTLEGKSLQELADEGRLCFERGDDYIKQGLMYYVEGGRRLIEAKRRLPHGQWQPWLKEHFSFSQDTATNRMKLAERFAESKSETFRNLKPSTAIKLLALPEGTEEEFIKAQATAGKPIENQSAREVQSAVKEFKQAKEIGGEYINVTGKPENNSVVEELNHAATNAQEPRQGVSNSESDINYTPAKIDSKPLITVCTGNNEWYTPAEYIEAARRVMKGIDLDPASCAIANEVVRADKFFSLEEDGLKQDWRGRIWLNPPYSRELISKFVDKLLASDFEAAIVLTDAATETSWFSKLAQKAAVICFATRRIKFLRPDGSPGNGNPTRGSAFFYFGIKPDKFCELFQGFGWCAKAISMSIN
ncbi:MAG: DUF3102 domain-containing protein [Selenomonadaceae bacterium]|nr:DUF3102 domain-containing protein [Selenomonadaceae bacterium]